MSAGLAVVHPVIGILGGMGPAATADFYAKIVRATPALRDQDHPQALIWSDPSIPDRTSALAGSGPHPGPQLADGARRLERGGAGLIAVPCNTAHAFLAEIQAAVDIPVLNMIEETRDRVIEDGLVPARKIALLATLGTVRARLYQHAFARSGVEVVVPPASLQERVAEAIACVKSDASDARAGELLASVVAAFAADGIDAVIAGCTELPIALAQVSALPLRVVDPTQVLAEAVVREAFAEAGGSLAASAAAADSNAAGSSVAETNTREGVTA